MNGHTQAAWVRLNAMLGITGPNQEGREQPLSGRAAGVPQTLHVLPVAIDIWSDSSKKERKNPCPQQLS